MICQAAYTPLITSQSPETVLPWPSRISASLNFATICGPLKRFFICTISFLIPIIVYNKSRLYSHFNWCRFWGAGHNHACQYNQCFFHISPFILSALSWNFPYNIVCLSSTAPLNLFSNRMSKLFENSSLDQHHNFTLMVS